LEYKDYYGVMGVKRDATQDDIKRAYRKLSRKYHPDVSKESDAEEKFKEVGEAYEVLKDPEKRAAYDQLGSQWKAGQDFRPPPGWDAGFEFSDGGFTGGGPGFHSDFFEELFGRHYASARPEGFRRGFHMRGEDHHAKILIDVEDSFSGAKRSISLRVSSLTEDGHVIARERTLNVSIPKEIRPGQQIRLAGQGGQGIGGGEAGNLYLEVQFRDHPLYRVDGADLYVDLPVAPWEAALGTSVKVPTPGGKVDLKIPPNSNQGRKLRLKGRGLPGKTPGDLYVVLKVTLPPADSEDEKRLYEEMKDKLGFNPRTNIGVT
jgi:curved DNA-binding protein